MAELKIVPIVPEEDEDNEPVKKRARATGTRKPRAERSSEAGPRIEADPAADPELPEFDPQAVEDEVKKRYNIDKVKVTELGRSRSGANCHKTGATRK